MKKTSRDIHPRNIPTNFEKNPNIGCRVRGVDGRTDRPTDRPTTRHGNRSSGPKNSFRVHVKVFLRDQSLGEHIKIIFFVCKRSAY